MWGAIRGSNTQSRLPMRDGEDPHDADHAGRRRGEASGSTTCPDILFKTLVTERIFPVRMNATSSAAAAPEPVVIPRHVKRIAIVVILGAIMSVLDTTIVNVALRRSRQDLDASLDQIQWVVSGYLLSLAAVIPITGWAADRFGARSVYLIALVLFTAGSALCGLASSRALIAFRVIQGIGGGMLMPIGQMILVKAAGPQEPPPRHEHDRRPDHPRPGLRPHPRRPAARARLLAVDLPRQRAGRHARLFAA